MCEAQTLILVKIDSTISGYHLYWLPDLGFLRFSLVDYRDTAEILNCDLLLGYGIYHSWCLAKPYLLPKQTTGFHTFDIFYHGHVLNNSQSSFIFIS